MLDGINTQLGMLQHMRTLLYREAISAGQGLAMAVWRAGELESWQAGEE